LLRLSYVTESEVLPPHDTYSFLKQALRYVSIDEINIEDDMYILIPYGLP